MDVLPNSSVAIWIALRCSIFPFRASKITISASKPKIFIDLSSTIVFVIFILPQIAKYIKMASAKRPNRKKNVSQKHFLRCRHSNIATIFFSVTCFFKITIIELFAPYVRLSGFGCHALATPHKEKKKQKNNNNRRTLKPWCGSQNK